MTINKNSDINTSSINFRIANKSTRFVNHLVDTIVVFFIIFLHAMVLDRLPVVIPEDGSPILGMYFFVLYVFYHALFEYFLGKTPGKYLSKTHVVTVYGLRPTFRNILGRNFCRLIPFDNISFLYTNRGFHDEFSKTSVVYDT